MRRIFALLLVAVAVSACTNWKEPTTITLMDGQVLKCSAGVLILSNGNVACHGVGEFPLSRTKSLSR